jgi:hypothetical protein
MRNMRARIERLEAMEPEDVILTLRDGSHFHCGNSPLRFYVETLEDIRLNRSSAALTAVLQTVSAEGCGLLWQVLQAIAAGPK